MENYGNRLVLLRKMITVKISMSYRIAKEIKKTGLRTPFDCNQGDSQTERSRCLVHELLY